MANDPTPGSAAVAGTAAADRSFFGHPRGLSTLFFTEMWERFSYYGMRALLILFMTAAATGANPGLGWDTAHAGAVYGLAIAFVYMMALPGGWVADHILGQRKAVLYGGILIALGNFSLAVRGETTFYLGLLLIILGTGLLKPNVSTMVGELYPEGGARRDAGFSIFYMGINIGAFLSPLIAGTIGQRYDWRAGFAVAGVGMVLGLIQYVWGAKHLGTAGLEPDVKDATTRSRNVRNLVIGLAALGLVGVGAWATGLTIEKIAQYTTYIIVSLTLLYFAVVLTAGGLTREEKGRVAAIGVLFLAAAVFWSGFDQAATSFNLVAEQLTDLNIGGWDAPASWLQSVNPLLIISLAPVFAWFWVWLNNRNANPSSPGKFAIGLVLMGLGFMVMFLGVQGAIGGDRISPMWLIGTYFLHTCAELFLSPVGLSTVTKLAPHRMVGQMMGIWFMATSLGNLIAGQMAGAMGVGEGSGEISAASAVEIFQVVGLVAIGFGILLALFVKPVRRMMGGVH
jgi:POT family proton-dependent oligopeptide transporter